MTCVHWGGGGGRADGHKFQGDIVLYINGKSKRRSVIPVFRPESGIKIYTDWPAVL